MNIIDRVIWRFHCVYLTVCKNSAWKALTWWRHQMETFSALLAIYAGNSPVPGEFPAQRPVTRSFDIFFHLRLNKRLSNAGDLRRHCAHYDVIVVVYNSDHRSLLARIDMSIYKWRPNNKSSCYGFTSDAFKMFTHQLRRTLDAVIHDEIDTVRWYLQQTKYMIMYVLSLFISTSRGFNGS